MTYQSPTHPYYERVGAAVALGLIAFYLMIQGSVHNNRVLLSWGLFIGLGATLAVVNIWAHNIINRITRNLSLWAEDVQQPLPTRYGRRFNAPPTLVGEPGGWKVPVVMVEEGEYGNGPEECAADREFQR